MGGRTVNYRIKEEMRKMSAMIYPEKENRSRKKEETEKKVGIKEKQRSRVQVWIKIERSRGVEERGKE